MIRLIRSCAPALRAVTGARSEGMTDNERANEAQGITGRIGTLEAHEEMDVRQSCVRRNTPRDCNESPNGVVIAMGFSRAAADERLQRWEGRGEIASVFAETYGDAARVSLFRHAFLKVMPNA